MDDYDPGTPAGVEYMPNGGFDQEATIDTTNYKGDVVFTYGFGAAEPTTFGEADTAWHALLAASEDTDLTTAVKATLNVFSITAGTVQAGGPTLINNGTDTNVVDSVVKIQTAAKIDGNVGYVVKYANSYTLALGDTSVELYDQATSFDVHNKTDHLTNGASITLDAVTNVAADGDKRVLAPDEAKQDQDFAKTGTYTIYFMFHDNNKFKLADNKWGEATGTLKVTNSIKFPTVDVTSRKIASDDPASFRDVIKVNCDLNNNDGAAESLVSVLNGNGVAAATNDKNKVEVKYFVVEENIFGAALDTVFWVSKGNTFNVE